MGDPLQSVLQGVGEVVHGVDAPFIPLPVVVHVVDPIEHRVAHIEITAGQVDLGPQGVRAVGEFARAHPLEQSEGFLRGPVPPGGTGGGVHVPPVIPELLGRQFAHVGQALLDELHGIGVHLFKIIGGKIEAVPPVIAQPADVLLDGLDVLHVLLGGVCIVHTQITHPAILFGGAEVHENGLGVADVEVAVGLGRKAGVDGHALELTTLGDILIDEIMDKVLGHDWIQFVRHVVSLLHIDTDSYFNPNARKKQEREHRV